MKTPSFIAVVLTILLGVGIASAASFATDLGSLVISTEPGTVVLWDENLLGTADDSGHMTISGIPLGTYAVSFRLDGFEGVARQLDIVAGDQALEVSLAKRPASEPAVSQVPVVGASGESASDATVPTLDPTLPDPFARQSAPLVSVFSIGFLIAVAAGALWLGRRRMEPEEEAPLQPAGPRVVMANEPRERRRPLGFYEDLRHRETVLEGLEERGPDRPRPKIIELPVADHRPMKEDG